MSGSFTRKKIDVTIHLGKGTFGENGFDTVTLSGLRVSASITKAGGASQSQASVRVYGVPMSIMNKVSTLGLLIQETRVNTLAISAGDDVVGMSQIYYGTLYNAFVQFDGMPNVCLHLQAYSGTLEAIKPIPPSSYPGTPDVATIMQALANQMGIGFENGGVSVQLSNPYFPGTGRTQAQRCAKAANINWIIDNNVLAIWPKGTGRPGTVPVISPQTGLVGYPSYDSLGVDLKTLFNPAIKYGSLVKVESSLTPACGVWFVHNLSSQTPGGPWFTDFQGYRLGNPATM